MDDVVSRLIHYILSDKVQIPAWVQSDIQHGKEDDMLGHKQGKRS